jgi:hypothetical protein
MPFELFSDVILTSALSRFEFRVTGCGGRGR